MLIQFPPVCLPFNLALKPRERAPIFLFTLGLCCPGSTVGEHSVSTVSRGCDRHHQRLHPHVSPVYLLNGEKKDLLSVFYIVLVLQVAVSAHVSGVRFLTK